MLNKKEFTRKATASLEYAVKYAGELGHTFVGSEHMIYGFIAEGGNTAAAILGNNGITAGPASEYLKKHIGNGIPYILSENDFSPRLEDIFRDASKKSRKAGATLTGTEYILLAIAENKSSGGYEMLRALNADIRRIKADCSDSFSEIYDISDIKLDEKLYPGLCRYSRNLTETASENGFDPVIGRENETDRIIQILSRKNKNNPCLVGEAGVGKTAIIEGLAQRIVKGAVPDSLRNKIILSVDIPSMLAGAKYRGDFEERIKKCIDEAQKSSDIILFIDEIHTIVGAGAAEGAIDAANILKPELARGNLRIIGATTHSEYRKFIESDSALERRFQPVTVDEPDREQLIKILSGIKPSYEKFHSVNISDDIINQAIYLSERYIPDRFLPDKAIDVIDEACSHAVMRNARPYEKKERKKEIQELLRKNIASSDIHTHDTDSSPYPTDVTNEDISAVISSWTGIPVNSINREEIMRLTDMETRLKKHIIGQERAVRKISGSIRRCRVGLKDENKPIGSFLFAGPTGVGKTELAKVIANTVFDSRDNMIRLDMSEYMEQHSVSKLIGSPPGYVGFRESGILSDMIRKKPYSVVLFDEIEKAHPDVLNILLQITDEGFFRDSQGRRTSMKNTLIILTSNIGAEQALTKINIGFSENEAGNDNFQKAVSSELKKHFKPELLNRMDDIIIFEPLSDESLRKISCLFLDELAERAGKINIRLHYSPEVADFISRDPETKKYGARPLKRLICDKIENIITEHIIKGRISQGDDVCVDIKDSQIFVEKAIKKQLI